MKIRKSIVSVGKTACIVIQFNYTPPKDKDISVQRRHFIEILQRRESIITYIDDLIEKINKTSNLTESRKIVYQYLPKFNEDFKSIEGISHETIDIKCENKSILYLTKRNSRLVINNLNTSLFKSINKFYIISPKDEEFKFTINNVSYSSEDIKKELADIDIRNFLYNLAYEEYCMGKASEALDILNISLKDKYLAKLIFNAFTAKERENCKEVLLRAAHNKKIKIKPRIWTAARLLEGIKAEEEVLENEPCFMDLLNVFEKNGDKFIPISSKQYKRIGKRVVDNYNVFKIDKAAKIATDFGNLVFPKEKINISIRYEIPGFVTINPRQAKAVGFSTNIFKAKIFREQTIIKDGNLNIEKFQALVSADTLEYLKGLKVEDLFTLPENKYYEHDIHTLIELNASKLPVLNRSSVLKSDSLDFILYTCYDQRIAECKKKVIKFFIRKQIKNTEFKDKKYSKEQAELLESYALDSKGVYRGVDNKVVKETSDKYEYRFFEFGIKGFSVLPKVEDLLVRMNDSKRKLNILETIMKEYIEYLTENHIESSLEQLNKLLEEQKLLIKKNARILAQIKLVKSITGDLWEGLKLDSKGNYLYIGENKTLVIKLSRKIIEI